MSNAIPNRILELGYAYREAKALLSAVELGVFTALAEGPLDLKSLTNLIGIEQRGARDFFDALVALDLLDRDERGRYACTPETALYLARGKPRYLGGDLEFHAQLYAKWNFLTRALKTGKPQIGPTKGSYQAVYADPGALDIFAKAMTAATLPAAMALAKKVAWSKYQTIMDIGSAQGCLLVQLAREHTHLTGGGFDLPPMRSTFDAYVEEHSLSEKLKFYPGDFLQDQLPSADVLVMGRVLHNWNFATKQMLLKKAYDALSAGGALIVYERLIDDARRFSASGLLDSLNMLIMTEGGFGFSGADCIGWMRETGFHDIQVQPLSSDHSMIIGTK